MTDTTDTAALREFLMEQIDHADSYGGKVWLCAEDARLAMSSLDLLEAERQQADALQTERDEFRRRLKLERSILEDADKELAALKGDQVPVAVVELNDSLTVAEIRGDVPRRKAVRELYEGALVVGQELFTAPQKPVVLDDATILAWGERNYIQRDVSTLRCIIDDAISLPAAIEAARGIMKDGE